MGLLVAKRLAGIEGDIRVLLLQGGQEPVPGRRVLLIDENGEAGTPIGLQILSNALQVLVKGLGRSFFPVLQEGLGPIRIVELQDRGLGCSASLNGTGKSGDYSRRIARETARSVPHAMRRHFHRAVFYFQ